MTSIVCTENSIRVDSRASLFERQNNRTSNWIGNTKTEAKVFERLAERIKRRNHVGPRFPKSVMSVHSAMMQ